MPLEERIGRARAAFDDAWAAAWRPLAQRLGRRAPALWASEQRRWRESVLEFIEDDLRRTDQHGWGAPQSERSAEHRVDLGDGVALNLVGRFDRVFPVADPPVVADYKTGNVKDMTKVTPILKGDRLQVPLYWLMQERAATVEVLGIGPRHDPSGAGAADRIQRFEGMSAEETAGFLETVRVLTALLRDGVFPLTSVDRRCSYCPYTLACRQKHPPTMEREANAADRDDYADIGRKAQRGKRTLDEVRGRS